MLSDAGIGNKQSPHWERERHAERSSRTLTSEITTQHRRGRRWQHQALNYISWLPWIRCDGRNDWCWRRLEVEWENPGFPPLGISRMYSLGNIIISATLIPAHHYLRSLQAVTNHCANNVARRVEVPRAHSVRCRNSRGDVWNVFATQLSSRTDTQY